MVYECLGSVYVVLKFLCFMFNFRFGGGSGRVVRGFFGINLVWRYLKRNDVFILSLF